MGDALMKVVTEIKYYETSRNDAVIPSWDPVTRPVFRSPGDATEPVDFAELVRGRRFRNGDGEEWVIGIRGDIAKLLGIPMEAWEEEQELRRSADRRAQQLQDVITRARRAGFWARLKWVFTGWKP